MLVLTPDLLLSAYSLGLFPMANDRDDPVIHWIEPRQRGVLPLNGLHVRRSMGKILRQHPFELRVNSLFAEVISACAAPTAERPRTWLNDELIELYIDMHARGHAHSIEAWQDGALVGGLYGLAMGAAFFGESMFSRRSEASKVCLCYLVAILQAGRFTLLDTQFVTSHLKSFGAMEWPKDTYRAKLKAAIDREISFARGVDRFNAQPVLLTDRGEILLRPIVSATPEDI